MDIIQTVTDFLSWKKNNADTLGLRGWVQNTTQKTVKGEIQGHVEDVEKMKDWLKKEGSPKSRIDKTVFGEQQTIPKYTFSDFTIVK